MHVVLLLHKGRLYGQTKEEHAAYMKHLLLVGDHSTDPPGKVEAVRILDIKDLALQQIRDRFKIYSK